MLPSARVLTPALTPNLRSAEDQRMASSANHILSRSWGFSIPSRLECNVIAGPYPERWASVRSFRRHEREERADDPKADRHLLLGPTDELEMVVQRRHAEDPAAAQLVAADLEDHRDGLG